MPDFIVPILEQIVARGDTLTGGILQANGVIANVTSGIAGVTNVTSSALNSVAAFATRAGTQAMSAAQRVAAMSSSAGGGSFAGVLGQTSSEAAGTISQQGVQDLIRLGYRVREFQICICPNCVGAARNAVGHLRVTGFNIEAPISQVQPPAVSPPQLPTEFKGIDMKLYKQFIQEPIPPPEPPLNIGLIIAIVLALKNQVEAGLRTFSDIVTTGLYRGNVGGATPFSNSFAEIDGGQILQPTPDPNPVFGQPPSLLFPRAAYPILDQTGNFVPPISSMVGAFNTPLPNLRQIPNREFYPNGRPLAFQERIRNVEQSVQGYFECTQYHHFCYTANIFGDQRAPSVESNRQFLQKLYSPQNLIASSMYLNAQLSQRANTETVIEEVVPIENYSGYWEAPVSRPSSDFAPYPDIQLILTEGEIFNNRNVTAVRKYGTIFDGAPEQPSFVQGWYFVPDRPMFYDHIVNYDNGYRVRMRPELQSQARVRYLGRKVGKRLWLQETTIAKDLLSIAGAILSPLTGGVSSIVAGVANMFIPNITFNSEQQTTIDTFAVQWYVPYALHYGSWTRPGKFIFEPKVFSPSVSIDNKYTRSTLNIETSLLGATFLDNGGWATVDPFAYQGGNKASYTNGEFGRERAFAYPSVYDLTITPLVLSVLTINAAATTPFGFTASWTAIVGADSYLLDVSLQADFSTFVVENRVVSGLTSIISGLTPSTRYYARVRGREQEYLSDFSNIANVTTQPFAPPVALPALDVDFRQFTANWTIALNAADYLLDIALDANFTNPLLTGQAVSGTSYTALNLAPNTNYWYRVRARSGNSTSGFSNVIQAQTTQLTLDPPVATSATTITTTQFTANWTSVPNALDYLLDVSLLADFSTTILNGQVVSGLSFLVPGLTPETRYYFRVRARNGAVISVFSNTQTLMTLSDAVVVPPPPFGTPSAFPSNITENSFVANWTAVQDATQYLLDVSLQSDFSSSIITGEVLTATSRSITGLLPLTTYYFRVRARNAQEISNYSATAQATTLQIPMLAPVATAASGVTTNAYTANWQPSANATQYRIYAGTNPVSLFQVGTSAGTSLPITGLQPNTTYFYQIDVVSPSVSIRSNIIQVTTLTPPPPPGINPPVATDATNLASTMFRANWQPSVGATEHRIDISTSPTFSSFVVQNAVIQSFNGNAYDATGLTQVTTYYYRVRAHNANINATSGNSNVISVSTPPPVLPPAAPTMTHFSDVTHNSFRFHWSGVSGASSYKLEMSIDDPTFASPILGNVSGFVSSQTGSGMVFGATLQSNKTYYVRAQSIKSGITSAYSNVISIRLNIATGGSVLRAPISNYANGSYALNNYTIFPPNTQPRDLTSTSVKLSWFPLPNRYLDGSHVTSPPPTQSYLLSVGKTLGTFLATTFVSDLVIDKMPVSGTSVVITGLQPDTEYFYSILTVGMPITEAYTNFRTGDEGFGYFNTQSIHTFRTLPQGVVLAPSNIGQVRFDANWQALPNVSFYEIELQTQAGQYLGLFTAFGTTLLFNQPQAVQTNFRYRVRGVNAQGARGDWSQYADVTVQNWFAPVPMNFDTITKNSFRVAWNNPANAVQVGILVKQGANTVQQTFQAAPSLVVNGLTPATTYNVQLFPRNQYSEGYFVPTAQPIVGSVTTLQDGAPPPPAPTLAFTSSTTNSIVVTLSNLQAATAYTLDIARDAAFTDVVASGSYAEAGANTVFGLQPDVLYYARARGNNGTQGAYSLVVSGRTQLAAPNLLVGEEITEASFRARWTSPQTVVQSRLDVARDAGFTDFVLNNVVVTGGLTQVVSGLQAETLYWMRVRTENARGTSPNSNVRQVITDSDYAGSVNVAII